VVECFSRNLEAAIGVDDAAMVPPRIVAGRRVADGAEEVRMRRLHDYWLEALSTCVTAVLVGLVYTVLAGYAAGPRFAAQETTGAAPLQHATAGLALR